MNTQDKYRRLQDILRAMGRVVVAFSGGVDSTFLLKAAVETLGTANVLACIGISPSLSQHQLDQARRMAGLIGAELVEIPLDELNNPAYQANKADRCFHCKSCQFRTIQEYARTRGIADTLCGTNEDDRDDYRPGNIAVQALGIGTPLLEARLTKAEIRQLSRDFGLPTADVPASPCLASRVAYGESITEEKLAQVERAEDLLRALGFVEFRVRHHGPVARIELRPEDFGRVMAEPIRTRIVADVKALGFAFVALDLQGFRSGALNEALTDEQKKLHP